MTRGAAAPLRVTVLDHTGELGGAELALVRTCEALRAHPDVQVTAVLFDDGPLCSLLAATGVAVSVLPLDGDVRATGRAALGSALSPRRLAATAAFVARLAAHLRRTAPDVVHTTSLKADLLGGVAARLARVPLVWHVHDRIAADYLPAPVVALVRALARVLPREVVVNSGATRATVRGRRTTVAHPGFAPHQATAEPRTAQPAGPVVGIIGRLSPTKGQVELLRAAPAILAAHPGARFRVVGAPAFGHEAYADEIAREVDRLGVGAAVDLVGFADPAAQLDDLAVMVHASPVPEPFGQVVVEAMARGVPVVATDAGGVPEIVHDGAEVLGRLVPPGDVAALAQAVAATLDDDGAVLRVAARAHASVLRRFPVERTAATLIEVWRRVAARAR